MGKTVAVAHHDQTKLPQARPRDPPLGPALDTQQLVALKNVPVRVGFGGEHTFAVGARVKWDMGLGKVGIKTHTELDPIRRALRIERLGRVQVAWATSWGHKILDSTREVE